MPTFGCAYWGRDAAVADRDFAAIAHAGFSWVVVPVSTERMRFDRAGTSAVIAAAKRHGLVTRVGPWGVGGIFGGEGVAEAGSTVSATLAWWLSSAHELRADAMFWDEPHGPAGLVAMTEAMTAHRVPGDRQYVYVNPDRSGWPTIPATTRLSGIGIDAYRGPDIALASLSAVGARYGAPVHVWVRSFGLSAEQSRKPAVDVRALLDAGVADIGVWGFPSAGCSCLDNAAPELVWNGIVEAIAADRAEQAA